MSRSSTNAAMRLAADRALQMMSEYGWEISSVDGKLVLGQMLRGEQSLVVGTYDVQDWVLWICCGALFLSDDLRIGLGEALYPRSRTLTPHDFLVASLIVDISLCGRSAQQEGQ